MLRKILVLVCLLFACTFSYAQSDVQGTFWGVPFGSSRERVLEEFSKHAKREWDSSQIELYFKGGYFAGIKWDLIVARFYEGKFCAIHFVYLTNDQDDSLKKALSIHNKLNEKYSELCVSAEPKEYGYSCHFVGRSNDCMFIYKRDTDEHGITDYYIDLIYGHISLTKRMFDLDNDEL